MNLSNVKHKWHLVDPSPWPFFGSIAALFITIGAALYFHFYEKGGNLLILGLVSLIIVLSFWWRDVIREGVFLEKHTTQVTRGFRLGMILFIISEIMFFFAFFWAFFHSALAPTPAIGCVWPPLGIETFDYFAIPLLNTIILLTSGATITLAHYFLLSNNRKLAIIAFFSTICLAIFFTALQLFEYKTASFSINDSVYGSTFFMATGFHGFHVIIGTIFIIVSFFRFINYHFSLEKHFGFEAAAWYWHFVDVVWLFLYIVIYFWGGK